jgi:hypothetical protein
VGKILLLPQMLPEIKKSKHLIKSLIRFNIRLFVIPLLEFYFVRQNPISLYNSSIAIENCVLADARVRLERDSISNSLRFKSLREITNFEDRWKDSKESTKKILKVTIIFPLY